MFTHNDQKDFHTFLETASDKEVDQEVLDLQHRRDATRDPARRRLAQQLLDEAQQEAAIRGLH